MLALLEPLTDAKSLDQSGAEVGSLHLLVRASSRGMVVLRFELGRVAFDLLRLCGVSADGDHSRRDIHDGLSFR
jgi:hypothetical protein